MNRDEAAALIHDSALSEHADQIEKNLAPSVRLIVCDDDDEPGSALSYFGGAPALPQGTAWPTWDKREYLKAELRDLEERLDTYLKRMEGRIGMTSDLFAQRNSGMRADIARTREELSAGRVPLAFLGQLSLREIHAATPLAGWPADGTLAFFYDPSQLSGIDPLHRGHCQVLFFPESAPLTPSEFPESLAAEARFPRRSVRMKGDWTLPGYLDRNGEELAYWRTDEYSALLAQLNFDGDAERADIHRCGGHPQEIQGEMRIKCQSVTQGIYCGGPNGYQDPRRAERQRDLADWQLLAQFDSDEAHLDWMWGDLGRVYFWARRQDIEAADFTKSWAIMQCY